MTMQRKIIINSQSTGKFQEQEINGRPHIVTQAVSISLDSVMNRIFYPGAAVRDSYRQLDRLPAPAAHPELDGRFVSASDPVAVNAYNIGAFVLNPRIDGRHIVNDLAIDVAVAERDERGAETLRRIRNGERIGMSTGLNGQLVLVAGAHEGQEYDGVISNIEFDHVAILLDEPPAGNATYTLNSSKPDDVLVCNLDTSVNELRDQLSELVRERFKGEYDDDAPYCYVVDIMLDPPAVIAEVGDNGMQKIPFEMDGDTPRLTGVGVKVRRDVSYTPENTAPATENEGEDMDKEKLVLAIIGNRKNSFTAADKAKLEAMSELELVNALAEATDAPAVTVEQAAEVVTNAGQRVTSAEDAEALETFKANRDAFKAFQDKQAEARTALVERIANASDMTAEDLEGMDDAKLERLANSLAPEQDYSGQSVTPPSRTTHQNSGAAVCADFA